MIARKKYGVFGKEELCVTYPELSIMVSGIFIENVEYVSKVLSNYMAIRNMLDRKFQNLIDEQNGL